MGSRKFSNFLSGFNRTGENLLNSVFNSNNSNSSNVANNVDDNGDTEYLVKDNDRKNSSSTSSISEVANEGTAEAEGFLCPQCFSSFPSADVLTEHFSSKHSLLLFGDQQQLVTCSECKMRFNTEQDLTSHLDKYHRKVSNSDIIENDPTEKNKIIAKLDEQTTEQLTEKFSRALKSAIEGNQNSNSDDASKGFSKEELDLLRNQQKTLEETKDLLIQEMSLLREELAKKDRLIDKIENQHLDEKQKLLEKLKQKNQVEQQNKELIANVQTELVEKDKKLIQFINEHKIKNSETDELFQLKSKELEAQKESVKMLNEKLQKKLEDENKLKLAVSQYQNQLEQKQKQLTETLTENSALKQKSENFEQKLNDLSTQKKTIEELSQKLQEKRTDDEKILKDSLNSCQNELNLKQKELNVIAQENRELKEAKQLSEIRYNELKVEKDLEAKFVEHLKKELEAKSTELANMNQKVIPELTAQMTTSLDTMAKEKLSLNNMVSGLQSKLNLFEKENEDLRRQVNVLQLQTSNTLADVDERFEKLETLKQEQIEQLQQTIDQLQEDKILVENKNRLAIDMFRNELRSESSKITVLQSNLRQEIGVIQNNFYLVGQRLSEAQQLYKNHFMQLSQQNNELRNQNKTLSDELHDTSTKFQNQNKQLSTQITENDTLTQKNVLLEKQLSEAKDACETSRSACVQLNKDLEETKELISNYQTQIKELNLRMEKLNEEHELTSTKLKTAEDRYTKHLENWEQEKSAQQNQLYEYKQTVAKLEDTVSKLRSERQTLENSLEKNNEQLAALREEQQNALDLWNSQRIELESERDQIKNQFNTVQNQCAKLENDLMTMEHEKETSQESLTLLQTVYQDHLKSCESERKSLELEISKCKQVLKNQEDIIVQHEQEQARLVEENQIHTEKITSLQKTCDQNQESYQNELAKIEQQLNSAQQMCSQNDEQLAKVRAELETVLQQKQTTEDNLGLLQTIYQDHMKLCESERKSIEEKLSDCEQTVEQCRSQISTLEAEKDKLSEQNRSIEDSLNLSKSVYRQLLQTFESERQIASKRMATLTDQLSHIQNGIFPVINQMLANLRVERDNLAQTALNMKSKFIEEHLNSIEPVLLNTIQQIKLNIQTKCEKKVSNLNEIHDQLEKEFRDLQENILPEKDAKLAQLVDSEHQLKQEIDAIQRTVKQLQTNEDRAKSRISLLISEKNNLIAEIEKDRARFENAQQFHDKTLSEKLQLEVELSTFLEEKRALLERCVAAEDQVATANGDIDDLSKKLDENIKAVHELGMQNQTLQIQLEQCNMKLKRIWTDDRLVDNCMNAKCNKQFGTVIRKHHCRNCGHIFCAECSTKTAQVTGHPKPVRVCDGCYQELSQL